MRYKKTARYLTHFFVVLVYGILFFSFSLTKVVSVYVGKSFHFLVYESVCTEVGIFDAQTDGGAGYVLSEGEKEYAVLAPYLNYTDAIAVQESMRGAGKSVQIKSHSIACLYFSTMEERRNQNIYTTALDCLHQYIMLLDGEISRLSKGATQESTKGVLGILANQFSYLSKIYHDTYNQFASYCQKVSSDLQKECQDTVYAIKLRYILCDLCVNYLGFAKEFQL